LDTFLINWMIFSYAIYVFIAERFSPFQPRKYSSERHGIQAYRRNLGYWAFGGLAASGLIVSFQEIGSTANKGAFSLALGIIFCVPGIIKFYSKISSHSKSEASSDLSNSRPHSIRIWNGIDYRASDKEFGKDTRTGETEDQPNQQGLSSKSTNSILQLEIGIRQLQNSENNMNFDKVHIVQETVADKQGKENASPPPDTVNGGNQLPSNHVIKSHESGWPNGPSSTSSEFGLTEQLRLAECVAKLQDDINIVTNHLEIQSKLVSTKDRTIDSNSPKTKITSKSAKPETKLYLREV